MALQLPVINTASGADTFQNWVDKTNAIINTVANSVMTANGAANGSIVTGNSYGNGIFGFLTLTANTVRGGNVQSSANLNLTSNLISTGQILTMGSNVTLNLSSLAIGANVVVTDSLVKYGNSTVNAVINSTAMVFSPNLTITGTGLSFGNSTTNGVMNTTGIYVGGAQLPFANNRDQVALNGTLLGSGSRINFIGSGSTILTGSVDVGNNQVNVNITSTVNLGNTGGTNTNVLFNQGGVVGGSNGINFDYAANNLAVGNNITIGANITFGKGGFSTDTIFVGNSTVNVFANSVALVIGTAISNALGFFVGANLAANASAYNIGNSTVNSTVNSTSLSTANINFNNQINGGNTVITQNQATWGNSSVNTVANSTALAIGGSGGAVVNAGAMTLGANVLANTSFFLIGNTTISFSSNSFQSQWANSTIATIANSTGLAVGANVALNFANVIIGATLKGFAANGTITANSYIGAGVMQSATPYWANTAGIVMTTDQMNGAGAYTTLTDAASIVWDMSTGINFKVTLGGNRTIANPTNVVVGRSGVLAVIEDGTGTRTLSYGANFIFDSDVAPVISTTASKINFLYYHCFSATQILITLAAKGV